MNNEQENAAVAAESLHADALSALTGTPAADDKDYLLVVEHLKKYFPVHPNMFGKPEAYVRAVDDVSFRVKAGTTVGIVGESGCGKSTMGRTILRLYDPTDGHVYFAGRAFDSLFFLCDVLVCHFLILLN